MKTARCKTHSPEITPVVHLAARATEFCHALLGGKQRGLTLRPHNRHIPVPRQHCEIFARNLAVLSPKILIGLGHRMTLRLSNVGGRRHRRDVYKTAFHENARKAWRGLAGEFDTPVLMCALVNRALHLLAQGRRAKNQEPQQGENVPNPHSSHSATASHRTGVRQRTHPHDEHGGAHLGRHSASIACDQIPLGT